MDSRKRPRRSTFAVLGMIAVTAVGIGACARNPEPIVVKPGCPAVIPGTRNVVQDFVDLVVWRSRTYVAVGNLAKRPRLALPRNIRLDYKITTVRCSLAEPASTNGLAVVAPGQWPDRVATSLPVGTPIYAARDVGVACAIVAVHAHKKIIYVAVNDDFRPVC